MGLFSGIKKALKKVARGVKKVVKKVAKGVKKVVKKVGKFVGKLGIVGQIGLSLLLPGVGSMLGSSAGWLMKASSPLLRGAGKFLNAAINVGTKAGNVFKTITGGVTKVVGHVVGSAANALGLDVPFKTFTSKLGMNAGKGIDISSKSFKDTFKVVGEQASKLAESGKDLFSMDTLTGESTYTKAYLDRQDAKYTKYGAKAVSDQLDVNIDLETGKPIVKKIEMPTTGEAESLLSKEVPKKTFTEAVKELPGKFKDEAIKGLEEAPGAIVQSVLDAPKEYVETYVEGKALDDAGAIPDQNSFAASVPTINTMTADIGTGGYETGFNPNMYTSNMNFISQNPIGQTATLHNAYQRFMQGAV